MRGACTLQQSTFLTAHRHELGSAAAAAATVAAAGLLGCGAALTAWLLLPLPPCSLLGL